MLSGWKTVTRCIPAASPLLVDIAARVTGGDPRRDAPDGVIQMRRRQSVNRDGEVSGEWRAREHLNPKISPTMIFSTAAIGR